MSKTKTLNEKIQVKSNIDQININLPITIKEIEFILNKWNSQSPGSDGIPYSFQHNLDSKSKENLLNIYNDTLKIDNIPSEWKRGIIIPPPKPRKNKNTWRI